MNQENKETPLNAEEWRSIEPQKSGFSVAALILGIIAIAMAISCCLTIVCFVPAIASIICAIIAKNRTHRWEGIAIAGFVCSVISLVIFVILMVFGLMVYQNIDDKDLDTIIEEYNNGEDPLDGIPGLDDSDDNGDTL